MTTRGPQLDIPSVLIGFILGILAVTVAVFIAIPLRTQSGQASTPTSPPAATPTSLTIPTPTTIVETLPPTSPGESLGPQIGTITLKGSGDKVVTFTIPAGRIPIAHVTGRSKANFIVESLAADGSTNDLLVNTIGNYSGSVLFDTGDSEHSVAFKVQSTGAWSIVITGLLGARIWDASGTLTGTGDDVIFLDSPTTGLTTGTFTHRGDGNFVVHTYSDSDDDLAINEIGHYNGQAQIQPGSALFSITANGPWTMTLAGP